MINLVLLFNGFCFKMMKQFKIYTGNLIYNLIMIVFFCNANLSFLFDNCPFVKKNSIFTLFSCLFFIFSNQFKSEIEMFQVTNNPVLKF